jgi:hypothetical protein
MNELEQVMAIRVRVGVNELDQDQKILRSLNTIDDHTDGTVQPQSAAVQPAEGDH